MTDLALPCPLCDPAVGVVLHESRRWRLVLNRNQNLLGKCFLALQRHVETVSELTSDEWLELLGQMRLATEALKAAFAPDHFNYVSLQNQDRHVHVHVVPRYAGERVFAEETFHDPGWPGHYPVDGDPKGLDAATEGTLVQRLRVAIGACQSSPD